jgi:Putative Ig domain
MVVTATSTTAPACAGTASYTLNVSACPVFALANINNGSLNTPYNVNLTPTVGVAPFTFGAAVGTLPTGTTFVPATGIFSGTATALGTFNFTISLTDANGCPGTRAYTVVISNTPPPPPPAPLTQFITFDSIPSQVFSNQLVTMLATASSTLPVTFTVVNGNATLAGQNFLTLTGLGEIVVTASQAGGFINNVTYLAAAPVTRL